MMIRSLDTAFYHIPNKLIMNNEQIQSQIQTYSAEYTFHTKEEEKNKNSEKNEQANEINYPHL